MNIKTTSIYEIKKDDIKYTFNSEKEACTFLGVKQCRVAGAWRDKGKCKGWGVKRIGISTHGETKTRLHKIWSGMIERCSRKKHIHFKDYGERGICVCEDWLVYENFRDWALNNGYGNKLTIDRINNNGNYEPNNCRWIPMKEQHNNKRTNHFVFVCGEVLTLSQCADKYNKPKSTVRYWENKGILEQKIIGADMRGVRRK